MASFNFNAAVRGIITGAIDLDTDAFKMLLVTSVLGETEKDTFDFRNDITNEVAAGGGYSTGGQSVTLTVAATDNTNNRVDVTAGAVTWATATITALGAVIYKSRGGASSADDLLCFIDFGGSVSSTAANFTVTPTGQLRFAN